MKFVLVIIGPRMEIERAPNAVDPCVRDTCEMSQRGKNTATTIAIDAGGSWISTLPTLHRMPMLGAI